MASAAAAIAILGELAQLEPIAFGLVQSLIHGLSGKSDADILAADATDLAAIVATAHAAAQPTPPSVVTTTTPKPLG
jgi:hypothetical protein